MTIKAQLEALKTAISAKMVAGLITAGLTALDEYVLGGPTDGEKTSCGFYLGVGNEAPDSQQFQPVIQMQLPGVAYADALSYFNVLSDSIKTTSPTTVGCVSLSNFSYTEFPPDEDSATIFTTYLNYSAERDDCDGWA